MPSAFAYFLFSILIALCLADIPGCDFEDTVDLTNIESIDGFYLYENIYIPEDQVDVYDYEELYNGIRVFREEHLRGCACKNARCIRFCCDPSKEELEMNTRDCDAYDDNVTLSYNTDVNVRYANGKVGVVNALKFFTPTKGIPCASNAIMDAENSVLSKWEILENGNLYKSVEGVTLSRRDYCLLPDKSSRTKEVVLVPLDCQKHKPLTLDELINDISKAISVPFIILTLLVYAFIPELQNLHGKCFMSYLVSLAFYYTIYSIVEFENEQIDDSVGCTVLGFIGYFFALGVFFWLNVISYDLYQSFRRSLPFRSSQKRRFLMYSSYAWGLPLCFTLILIGLDYSSVNSYYKPGVEDGCWIDTFKWPAVAYFTGVNLTIVLVDLIFLSLTFYKITTAKRDINKMMNRQESKKSNMEQDTNSFGLFLRLFLVMGITWIFEAIETIETLIEPFHRNPMYYVTDFLNAIIGVLIFICFVLNRKVLGLIKKTIQRRRGIIADSSLREQESMLSGTDTKIPSISRRN